MAVVYVIKQAFARKWKKLWTECYLMLAIVAADLLANIGSNLDGFTRWDEARDVRKASISRDLNVMFFSDKSIQRKAGLEGMKDAEALPP
ncbi:hypothetical protein WN944_018785 [Citrus x changshan-huyou]|uniref:Uncharacterized protein n=1 Tax=Citrus x changshan-huyou TaxID=2935761 RepID=A0AAP0LVE3_9ROSI